MPDHSYSGRGLDIACDVGLLQAASLDDEPQPSRRPRRGVMQSKPVREFTVRTSPEDPGTLVRADAVNTLGDWFTLTLGGQEVYGAPRERVLQYTAGPATEGA